MIRCKECKYWNRYTVESEDISKGHFGSCSHSAFVYDPWGYDNSFDGLIYWDAEAYDAGFYTGEDFGCIHGAAR